MYITGWRSRSEVFPLTWAQVDWADGFVRLEPGMTKNREGRAFPLMPVLRAARAPLRAYSSLRTGPGPDHPVGLSSQRPTDPVDGQGVAGGRQKGGRTGATPPRSAEDGGPEPGAGGGLPVGSDEVGSDEDDGAQDGVGLPAV